ncbi:DoxX family protein [Flavobacterium cyanobacteriorum]|uniref:DoxX family protein n=1 Tax=Flavobacterium cyanobacteriorum TaxID=2022802 RepID=A0A255YWR0_9FLAO|nr:BT_3928 family protein [Flavobacterium cyanobacteriorum]OYQ33124.1 DoxX family protein [Flavobacterium cyanobacteriorum]
MKIITNICRVLVGVLFIISGLIKLNDPVGFSFKLQEYFNAEVLNLEFLIPYALAFAVFVVIFEVVLGIMLLVGYKKKFTLWSLLLMIVFFTFLTFYSAYFNKVTDCGCFGDALKLTPWESFTKDVVLLVLILVIFFNQKYVKRVFSKFAAGLTVYSGLALCGLLAYYVLMHLPIIDFRAYKIGTNIRKGMEVPPGAPKSVYEIVFIYKVNGAEKEFTDKELDKIPADAEYVDRKDKLVKEGYVPPIHDFTLELDGANYTEELLNEPKLVMFISYDLEKASDKGLGKLEAFAREAQLKGYKVIGATASPADIIAQKKKQHGLSFNYYFCDATTLKTIERANPSIVILEKGTIKQKAHWNDIEHVELK